MNVFNTQNIFDSSTITSVDEFVSSITPQLKDILVNNFPNNRYKQEIRIHGNNRISFACPICGDSHNDNRKKRGNIILDNNQYQYMYKCWNCGAYMSVDKFFRMYGKALDLSAVEYIHNNKNVYENIKHDASMNVLFDIEGIENISIDKQYIKNKCHLIDVKNTVAEQYLVNRNQYKFDNFLYDATEKMLYILNLTPNGKIFGLQTRPLYKCSNAKYKTYKLSNIYSMILHEDIEIDEKIDNLSMFFNILNIDFNIPVVVTEGPMDAFLLKNGVATCGAGKRMPVDLNYYYLYDDDKTGREKAFDKLNSGFNVFLWDKFKSDLELPRRQKWDYNDVINYCKSNNIKIPFISQYFSNDKFDIINI